MWGPRPGTLAPPGGPLLPSSMFWGAPRCAYLYEGGYTWGGPEEQRLPLMVRAPRLQRLGAPGAPLYVFSRLPHRFLGRPPIRPIGAPLLTGGVSGGPPSLPVIRATAGARRWYRLIVFDTPTVPKDADVRWFEPATHTTAAAAAAADRKGLLDVYRCLGGPSSGAPPQHIQPSQGGGPPLAAAGVADLPKASSRRASENLRGGPSEDNGGRDAPLGAPLEAPPLSPVGPLRAPCVTKGGKVGLPLSAVQWEALASRTAALCGFFQGGDIAVVWKGLRASGMRDRELQRLLHARLQQLPPALFAAAEVRKLLLLLQQCGWRSVRTLRHLAAAFLLVASTANPSCCRELMAAYARLCIPLETETDRAAFAAAAQRVMQLEGALGPKDLTLCLNSIVRCADTPTMARYVAALSKQVPRLAPSMSPMQLALTANALAAAAAATAAAAAAAAAGGTHTAAALRALEKAAVSKRDIWGPQDAALLVNAFTKLEVYSQLVFDAAAEHAEKNIRSYSPQHMSLVAHAFAHFGQPRPSLVAAISAQAPRCMQQFKGKELATLILALAKLGCTDSSVAFAVSDEVLYRLTAGRHYPRFSLSLLDLQQIALGLQNMNQTDPRLFAVLTQAAKEALRRTAGIGGAPFGVGDGSFSGEEGGAPGGGPPLRAHTIACLMHALAKAGVKDEALCNMLGDKVLLFEKQFSSLGLALVAAAAVSLHLKHAKVWEALQRQGALRAPQMPLDTLIALLAAVSKGPPSGVSEAFLRAATTRLKLHVLSIDPAALAAAVVALQRVGWRDSLLLARACKVFSRRQRELSTRALCGVSAALAKLSVYDAEVYVHLNREAYARLHQLSQEDAATLVYANLLLLQMQPQQLEQTHQQQQQRQEQQQQQQQLQEQHGSAGNEEAAGSILQQQQQQQQQQKHVQQQQQQQHHVQQVLFGEEHKGLVFGLLQGVLEVLHAEQQRLSAATVYRLQLACLFFTKCLPSYFASLPSRHQTLLIASLSVPLNACSNTLAQSSLLHRSVSRGFVHACIPHQSEVHVGPLTVDLLLHPKVCVEVDGPPHYYRNTLMLTAATRFKLRLLKALGFTVGRVTYIEWEQLTTRDSKTLYCLQLARRLLLQQGEDRRHEASRHTHMQTTAASAIAATPNDAAIADAAAAVAAAAAALQPTQCLAST
ncbi:hypothetical protein ACSSS7_005789 [Eimeria intestinalis]